jgi:hypothetical protein
MGVIILLFAAGVIAIGSGFLGYGIADLGKGRKACVLSATLFYFVAAYLFGWVTGSSLYMWILLSV